MREALHTSIGAAVQRLLRAAGESGDPPEFTLEIPKNPDHGDFACNAAMLLAKRLRQSPRDIAGRLIAAANHVGSIRARPETVWFLLWEMEGMLADLCDLLRAARTERWDPENRT